MLMQPFSIVRNIACIWYYIIFLVYMHVIIYIIGTLHIKRHIRKRTGVVYTTSNAT